MQANFMSELFKARQNILDVPDIVGRIEANNGVVDSSIISDAITNAADLIFEAQENYKKYIGKVPILEREFEDPVKINRKIANDYYRVIVDTMVGYMLGNPVSYQLDDRKYMQKQANAEGEQITEATTSQLEEYKEYLDEFLTMNDFDDLDSETGKHMFVCGYAARLCYIDEDGMERVCNIDPWEAVFIEDNRTGQIKYALRFYRVEVSKGVFKTKVEWYDEKNITFFIGDIGNFQLDTITEGKSVMPHMFDYIPLIRFKNNNELKSDFTYSVSSNIDSYDRLISDVQNELEENRLAYMVFSGVIPDTDTIIAARQSGAFGVPEGSTITYLEKDIKDAVVEHHKKTINENIYKFSQIVDMSDESFSGNQSGESRKWKMLGMETKAILKERKFTSASREMFRCILSAWAKKGIIMDYRDIYLTFTRNIPIELSQEAEIAVKLKGAVSEETRLGLLSFIDDVQFEIDKMKEQKEENMQEFLQNNGENVANTEDDDIKSKGKEMTEGQLESSSTLDTDIEE